ncbi:MAG: CsiV family protein [Panacagrimonas sp.]
MNAGRRRPLNRLALALVMSVVSLGAQAATWRVDMIVFRYLPAVDEVGRAPITASLGDAIELTDTTRLSKAGITLLPESDFRLTDHWSRLRSSAQFRPLIRLAWTQNEPPVENGPRLRLRAGNKFTLGAVETMSAREAYEIDGSVALHLNRFLHLDTRLVYTEAGDSPASWLLQQSRRMRSDELHHIDSPKLGVIAQVTKWVP